MDIQRKLQLGRKDSKLIDNERLIFYFKTLGVTLDRIPGSNRKNLLVIPSHWRLSRLEAGTSCLKSWLYCHLCQQIPKIACTCQFSEEQGYHCLTSRVPQIHMLDRFKPLRLQAFEQVRREEGGSASVVGQQGDLICFMIVYLWCQYGTCIQACQQTYSTHSSSPIQAVCALICDRPGVLLNGTSFNFLLSYTNKHQYAHQQIEANNHSRLFKRKATPK